MTERCTLRDKTNKGNFIHIKGEKSRGNLIESSVFRNHAYDGGNGGEAIIIGDNDMSGCMFETTIKKCEFIRCKGDDEIVSIKNRLKMFLKRTRFMTTVMVTSLSDTVALMRF
jgi:hypothetical protein